MHRGMVVLVLCAVQFVDVLGVTSTTTAIPAVLDGLDAPGSAAGPLAVAYPMFFGGLLVLGARLGDRYGSRRVLAGGVVVFTVAAAAGGVAQDVGQLLVVRAVQGGAAAVCVPCALRLLLVAAGSGRDRAGALALWSASGAVAGAAGFLVGGLLTDVWGWRSVFWVNVPIGVLLLAALLRAVPAPPPEAPGAHLDLPGAGLLIGAVMAVVAGASLVESPASRPAGVALAVAGAGIGLLFVRQQRRSRGPLLPAGAVRSPQLRAGTVVSFVNTATTSSAAVLATLVLQDRLGASPLQAGLALLPISVAAVVGSAATRPLTARLPMRVVGGAGLLGICAGNVLLAATFGTAWGVVAGGAVIGLGLGAASVAGNSIGTEVAPELEGSASGVLNTGAQLGTALGVAALVLVAAGDLGPLPGTALAWAVAALAAAGCAAWLVRSPALR
ncbi:MFS family permease [Modestobacter versicolor]|uniref:MFS family permease n=2 Tax=Modestobacter versicolor TaxID=429133 RepID=A0A839Y9Z8_9ACTN|nr:MFS family permease [Modestobacter versicolor]